MLSRRYLRVKIFQALYSHFQAPDKKPKETEQQLLNSIDRMYDLYLLLLLLVHDLQHHLELSYEESKVKKVSQNSENELKNKFIDNQVFKVVLNSSSFLNAIKKRKISWDNDQELISKLSYFLKKQELYQNYIDNEKNSFEEDQEFAIVFFKKIIPEANVLLSELQDKSIFWGLDEIDFILSMVIKTVKKVTGPKVTVKLLNQYRDEKEDLFFIKNLFNKVVLNDAKNSELIAQKTKNWEVDRIAMVDILLMKMAVAELLFFESIPVKVTLNEYIELSKLYSSPKSKVFVNGVLDKLVDDFQKEGKLKKVGRGLIEG